jgi:hypothetical protein
VDADEVVAGAERDEVREGRAIRLPSIGSSRAGSDTFRERTGRIVLAVGASVL